MDSKMKRDKNIAVFDIALIVVAYVVEKLICIFCADSRALGFALAIGMVAVYAIVCSTLINNKNTRYALMAALLGYKMALPSISMLEQHSVSGAAVYFMIAKLALAAFAILVLKLYFHQNEDEKVNAVVLLSLMVVVPFSSQISQYSYSFFMVQTGSMLGYYLTQLACYGLASMVILFVAYKSNLNSFRFATCFEYLALSVNASRRIGAIAANAINGTHISRSYYLWLVLYAVIAVMFFVAARMKNKS